MQEPTFWSIRPTPSPGSLAGKSQRRMRTRKRFRELLRGVEEVQSFIEPLGGGRRVPHPGHLEHRRMLEAFLLESEFVHGLGVLQVQVLLPRDENVSARRLPDLERFVHRN